MFVEFFYTLREAGVPVTPKEFLSFLDGMKERVIEPDVEDFYYFARTALVKDERFIDPFDKAFAHYFKGAEKFIAAMLGDIPPEWLDGPLDRMFTDEELAAIKALGGWDAVLDEFRKRLEEQDGEHHGGDKWIGTGGTSPYGSGGYNPEGIRVGEGGQRQGRAMKVWEQRQYAKLSHDVTLNTRNIKLALKRLRLFTREGMADELDIDRTIRDAARNGAMLDIAMRPSRKNRVKVLVFYDIGGSMTPHVKRCEQLFSSTRSELKHLESFYFHNCIYESVWREESRWEGKTKTWDILHKYNRDYRVIIVGDASMSPYELVQVGGSIDHFNDEPGMTWLTRIKGSFPHAVWLNPEPQKDWQYVESIKMIHTIFDGRMYPLSLDGLAEAMDFLRKRHNMPALPHM
jgi:uncharacterized protein with von Willebrand factor type A (vWA) domain